MMWLTEKECKMINSNLECKFGEVIFQILLEESCNKVIIAIITLAVICLCF